MWYWVSKYSTSFPFHPGIHCYSSPLPSRKMTTTTTTATVFTLLPPLQSLRIPSWSYHCCTTFTMTSIIPAQITPSIPSPLPFLPPLFHYDPPLLKPTPQPTLLPAPQYCLSHYCQHHPNVYHHHHSSVTNISVPIIKEKHFKEIKM